MRVNFFGFTCLLLLNHCITHLFGPGWSFLFGSVVLAIPARKRNQRCLFRRILLEVQIDINTPPLVTGPCDPEPDQGYDIDHADSHQASGRGQSQARYDEVENNQNHTYNKAPGAAQSKKWDLADLVLGYR